MDFENLEKEISDILWNYGQTVRFRANDHSAIFHDNDLAVRRVVDAVKEQVSNEN